MSRTSIRTLLPITLAFALVGLAAATWGTHDRSIAPMTSTRAAHSANGDGITVAMKTFKTSDNALRFFKNAATDLGRNDPRTLAAFCPLDVPGAVEVVLGHPTGTRETILLLAHGDQVHRLSRLDPPGPATSDIQHTIVAAAQDLTR